MTTQPDKPNTPSGETVNKVLTEAFLQGFKLALGNFYNITVASVGDDKEAAEIGKQLKKIRDECLSEESASLRQAIEGMVERILGPKPEGKCTGTDCPGCEYGRASTRAKEELSKMFLGEQK